MKHTFTNIGNHEIAYVILGNENDADPIVIQVGRGKSHSIHLTEAQEKNLADLRAQDPGFFERNIEITPA